MTYVPNSPLVYTAAFAGALAGMGVTGRQIFKTNPADYDRFSMVAGDFAQEFDTVWNDTGATSLDAFLVEEACQGFWSDRLPGFDFTQTAVPAQFNKDCQAIVALLDSAIAYFGSQGIVPPGFGASGNFWPYDKAIPATVVNPLLQQAAGTDPLGAAQPITIRSMPAGQDPTNAHPGGQIQLVLGKSGPVSPNSSESMAIYWEKVVGGVPGDTPTCPGMFGIGVHSSPLVYLNGGDPYGTFIAFQIASYPQLNMASHTQSVISTIDGGHVASLYLQCNDTATAGYNGAALQWSYFSSIGNTDTDVGFQILRDPTSVTSGGAIDYIQVRDGTASVAGTERFALQKKGNYANAVFDETTGAVADTAATGFIRLPFGAATFGDFPYITSRNQTSDGELEIISRQFYLLTFGSLFESNQVQSRDSMNFQMFHDGDGWKYFAFSGGYVFAIRSGTIPTYVHGEPDTISKKDGTINAIQFNFSNGAAPGRILATIPLQDGTNPFVLNTLDVTIQGKDSITGDFASCRIKWSYMRNGATIIPPNTPAVPTVEQLGNTTAAGVTVNPRFNVVGTSVQVLVDPWTANLVGWSTTVKQYVTKQDST